MWRSWSKIGHRIKTGQERICSPDEVLADSKWECWNALLLDWLGISAEYPETVWSVSRGRPRGKVEESCIQQTLCMCFWTCFLYVLKRVDRLLFFSPSFRPLRTASALCLLPSSSPSAPWWQRLTATHLSRQKTITSTYYTRYYTRHTQKKLSSSPAQVPKLSKNCAMTLISPDLVWRFLICKAIRLQQQHLNAGLCLCEAACFIMWVLLRLYPPAAHDAVIESKHLTCFRSTQRQQPFSSFLCKPFIA